MRSRGRGRPRWSKIPLGKNVMTTQVTILHGSTQARPDSEGSQRMLVLAQKHIHSEQIKYFN